MWEKKFIIAEKSTNKKLLAIACYYALLFLLRYLIIKFNLLSITDNLFFNLALFVFIGLPLIYILVAAKNYRAAGQLIINSHQIHVSTKLLNDTYLIDELEYITLYFKGIYGEDYAGYAGGIAGAYSKDGSGNYLEFSHKLSIHKVNIVFEGEEDFNALKFLFKEIEENGAIVPKIVYPFNII